MTRVLRKCQFTEQSDRNLLSNKMEKEIMSLEKWFQNMASSLNERVSSYLIVKLNKPFSFFFNLLECV